MYLRTAITPQKGLYCLCALLLAACAYEAWAPLPAVAVPDRPITMHATLPPVPIAFIPPASSTFDTINNRPIFSPDRKAIAPTGAASANAAATPPSVSLVGVILDGTIRMALIKTAASPLETAFGVGETIDGWQVAEIDPDRVVLRSGALSDEIKFDAGRAAKSASSSGQAAHRQTPVTNQQQPNQVPPQTPASQSVALPNSPASPTR